MAGAYRGSSADLTPGRSELLGELLSKGRSFSFFQALRLLHQIVRAEKGAGGQEGSTIRVRPKLSLSFPSADIDAIELLEGDPHPSFRITANFLSLYGPPSPLPTFYTEDLLAEAAEDESVSRDFLDILHHRLYMLLYQGWKKYRLFLQVAEEIEADGLERLFCLIGLGHAGQRCGRIDPYRLLRYVGLFTQFPRSAAGLAALLSDALQEVPLRVIPCVFRRARIPENQRLRMGLSGSRLGIDSYVGEEIEDRMGQFRIQIGPLDQADFLRFTPGQPGHAELTALTDLYLTDPLVVEIELILAAHQARTATLGDPICSVLGVTTWVFSSASLGEVRTRFIVHRYGKENVC
jgi:type VI secretion system protein ImpH